MHTLTKDNCTRIIVAAALLYEIEALYEWLCDNAVRTSTRSICPQLRGFLDFSHVFVKHAYSERMHVNPVQRYMDSPRIQWFSYDTGKKIVSIGVLVTGIGKTAAASAVGAVSACIQASFIITGCVLGVSPFLRFLDTILFTKASQYDINCRKFSKNYGTMPDSNSHHVISHKHSMFILLDTALQHTMSEQHTKSIQWRYYNQGYILTGDTFITVDGTNTLPDGATALIQSHREGNTLHADHGTDTNILYKEDSYPIAIDMETAAMLYASRRGNNSAEALGIVLDCMSDTNPLDFYHAIRTISLHIKGYIVRFLNTLL